MDDEMIAVTVYEPEATQLLLAMWAATRDWYEPKGTGGLWEAYRIYCGLDPN